ncbi:hypothetical protein AJ78_08092 [Emergomyces pasteurianus Ep9510]|uniref:Uncharacterized protein n=1 Tax=Emergomyces pasteurianus Ep9510 TaxID=1447872 RepID=A0A1J9P3X1_9EURO|nr:hypothetical protein AJ78_08092 [Emergomyces pasteurianus Ep9510]
MQYLAEHTPEIPALKTHGLIRFEPSRAILMSYIPDMTLARAWFSLSLINKVLIQQHLGDIFHRLRTLHQRNSNELEGVSEEEVKEYRVNKCTR